MNTKEYLNITKKATEFQSIEQRVIASFFLTMPEFYPSNEYDIETQKNLYEFTRNILEMIYNEPTLLFTKENSDYGYINVFSAAGSGNEVLMDIFRKDQKEVFGLFQIIKDLGYKTFDDEKIKYEIKISKRIKNILKMNNLDVQDNLIINNGKPFFKALKWFSQKPSINLRHFIMCAFDDNHDYQSDLLCLLCNKEEGACEKIREWLLQNNYYVSSYITKYDNNNDYSIHFIKNITGKEDKIGFPYMGDSSHIGFSIEYRYCAKVPYFCTIRIQNFKGILKDINIFSDSIKSFIIRNCKKCNNCFYCNQMDKSKPQAHTLVEYNEKSYLLCPYYPGFSFSFKDLTNNDANTIIDFLSIIEKYNLNK